MTSPAPTNPFAGIAAMMEEQKRNAQATSPSPAPVAAPVADGTNPFSVLIQPPPFAPVPAAHPLDIAEAPSSIDDTVVTPEAPAAPEPVADTPEPEPAPAPKKRGPGRPRKPKPAVTEDTEVDETKDRESQLRDIAVNLPPSEAFVTLSAEVSTLEEKRRKLVDSVGDTQARIMEFESSRVRTEHQIEELRAHLETIREQSEKLNADSAAASTELAEVDGELTVAADALARVRDFIATLSGGKPGIIGNVRITVLDGTTHIDPL